ncbi:hypothetical protein EPUS_07064 [Endocarpon pusillum Z07020]|uniref:Uncharacterized protein n=1 Tax=Endocarpon pusillum (strain Z07020 / HMAS-L-300199) TaxID=1263415 RepID=U1GFD6_ENDPU|nr:uncharacterized protein EPUS_07064 [Endocarpon pusillum Z07020]ERF76357.1 hypothetical protein EPUS_07064 [Endocarpon pusillum Z07020]
MSSQLAAHQALSQATSIAEGDEHELQTIPSISAPASSTTQEVIPSAGPDIVPSTDEGTIEGCPLLPSTSPGPTPQSLSVASVSPSSSTQSCWRTIERWWRNSWAPETFCLALVLVSLTAICVVLWKTQGKPRPQWPMGISVNALIAVFVVLLKAGISLPVSEGLSQLKWQLVSTGSRQLFDIQDYDSASRGAWGSLQFLLKPDTLAFDGSGIVLFKPWTWRPILQLLKLQRENFIRYFAKVAAFITVLAFIADPFPQQLVEYVDCAIDSPSMAATVSRATIHHRTGGHVHTSTSVFLPELAVAITVGTTFPPKNTHSLVNTNCPSNNCTFPRFETLGICHTCEDISGEIQTFRDPTTLDHPEIYFYNHMLVDQRNQTYLWADDRLYPLNTTAYGGGPNDTFHLKVLKASGRGKSKPVAFDCELYPCVKEYNSSIKNAVLTEELITTTRIPWSGTAPGDFELAAKRTLRDGVWEDCAVDPSTNFLPEDCLWSISIVDDLVANLAEPLGGQYMTWAVSALAGSTVARKLWNNDSTSIDSLNAYFGDLADVLTATIRNTGNKNMSSPGSEYPVPIRGMAQVLETCIDVRWKWLSFLTMISGFTLLFWLSFWCYYRAASRYPMWKSSSLALLFCSLDDQIKDLVKGYPTRDAMFEASKRTAVRLVPDNIGKASLERVL